MILYFLAFIFLFISICFIYIRLKFKFWALQPVFHFYDIYYWFVNVGIIRHGLPNKNRYVNLNQIKTFRFDELKQLTKKTFVSLIRINYFSNNENKYDPTIETIEPYFIGHNRPVFLSFFYEPEILIDNRTGTTIKEDKMIGSITSRPLNVIINTNNTSNSFEVYYVDYLCVNKTHRKKNIAPQLIQTHEYNQSHQNKDISVSLFKREEELTGIIPLTLYKTSCFNTKLWSKPEQLSPVYSLLTCDKKNIYYFIDFINLMSNTKYNKLDVIIYPSISNLIHLIQTNNLIIKMVIYQGEIVASYVFRKTQTFISKNKEILSCIASIQDNSKISNNIFIQSFKNATWSILKQHINFNYLSIEDVCDNSFIIANIILKTTPIASSPMAYFFYNFAHNPFNNKRCFIIN